MDKTFVQKLQAVNKFISLRVKLDSLTWEYLPQVDIRGTALFGTSAPGSVPEGFCLPVLKETYSHVWGSVQYKSSSLCLCAKQKNTVYIFFKKYSFSLDKLFFCAPQAVWILIGSLQTCAASNGGTIRARLKLTVVLSQTWAPAGLPLHPPWMMLLFKALSFSFCSSRQWSSASPQPAPGLHVFQPRKHYNSIWYEPTTNMDSLIFLPPQAVSFLCSFQLLNQPQRSWSVSAQLW